MEIIYRNREISKINEPHKLILNLSQRLDFNSSNKRVSLQELSITRGKI